jgi:hypothetical protein
MSNWEFKYPPSTAVIANRKIFQHGGWIAYVSHEVDEAGWQFHTNDAEVSESDAQVVSLEDILNHDPSICELADLPVGWQAWRASAMAVWKRSPL